MFGYVKKTKVADKLLPYLKALQQISLRQTSINGIVTYGFNDSGDQLDAYATVDDLYSIVRKIAKTCKRIPLYAYEVKDEKSYAKYKMLQRKAQQGGYTNKIIWDLKEHQHKSLEIIGDNDKLQALLDNPTKGMQSKDEFYEAAYAFPLLSGNEYIYLNVLGEGASMGEVYNMWHLPPNFTSPIRSNDIPRRTVGFTFYLYERETFELEQVIHRKYFNPVYDFMGNELVGLSPLRAASRTLTQISNETDYTNRSLINSGREGAVVGEDIEDLTPETLGQMKDDVLRELGPNWNNGTNQTAKGLGFLAGKWSYLKFGISPVDMQLIEQRKQSKKDLCDVFGISDILFNNSDAGTDNIVKHMVKEMYTNVVLPEVCSFRDSLQQGVAVRYKDKKRVIDFDVSDITELQEDMTSVVTRFSTAPAFRVNDLYEALGWGRLDDPNADVVLIKQGYSPLADISAPIDLNLTGLNDYNANS